MASSWPVEMSASNFQSLKLPLSGKVYLARTALPHYAKAGEVWPLYNGKRLILSVYTKHVFFMQVSGPKTKVGKIYIQSLDGFRGEVVSSPFIKAARNTRIWVKIIEYEMQFLLGVCTAVSGLALAAAIGAEIVKFVAVYGKQIPKWANAVKALYMADKILEKAAPTVRDAIMDSVWKEILAGLKVGGAAAGVGAAKAPKAIAQDPKLWLRLAGTILGKIGKKMFQGKLGVISGILAVLLHFLTKVLTSIPKGLKLAAGDVSKLVRSLKATNPNISEKQVNKMLEEVKKSPKEVKMALQILKDGFKGIAPATGKKP